MSASYAWLLIGSLMVLVLTMRWSFLFLPRRYQPKGELARALSFAPLAALIAICAPEIFRHQITEASSVSLAQDWRLWGGVAMLLVASLTRSSKSSNLFGLLAAALVVFWL
jgi:branched-subunit amino acid transport protein